MKQTFKRLTAVFAAAALAVTCLPLTAIAETLPQEEISAAGDTGEYQGFSYEELEDGTLAITGYVGSDTEITIPSEINGKKVTVIGENAFYYKDFLTEITIPDTVTTIEGSAFASSSSLTKINLSRNLTTIGSYAFAGCTSLQTITIPDSVTTIENSVFSSCSSLTEITLPTGLKTISIDLFYYCTSLKEISLPNSLTEIEDWAFYGCSSLTEITIPENVTTIGEVAFGSCEKLTAINVDKNNKNYQDIDGVLFSKDGKTIFKYPEGKTDLSYAIPNGVTTIATFALDGTLLSEINVPESVVTIEDSAIFLCYDLKNIYVDKNNQNFKDIDGILFTKDETAILKLPIGRAAVSYTVPDGVTTIGIGAFESCSSLEEIILPDGLTIIDAFAFEYCDSLSEIILPYGLKKIERFAFSDCSSLTEITLPDGVESIGLNAFENCVSLAKIVIPASVTEIVSYAFGGDPDITFYGYKGSYAETYANNYNIRFVPLNNFADKETGIEIIAGEDSLPADAKLNIEQTEQTDTSFAYNITITKDGKEIQPEGEVSVRIPVPEGWSGKEIHVYHKDANGRLTDMNAVISGDYIIFTTDHFSEYVVTTEKQDTVILGDVNGDGEVGELDSVELARYLANWNVTIDKDAADLDGDGEVGETDSVILARRLAGWNV